MSVVDDFWNWVDKVWGKQGLIQSVQQTMPAFATIESLETYYKSLPPDVQQAPGVLALYRQRQADLKDLHAGPDPITGFISGALDAWLEKVEEYGKADPAKAKENLSKLSAHVIEVAAASAAIDYALGAIPTTSLGEASSANTKQLLTWLGFGAVLAAVAHDPVKIGLLRPYQDSLEQTFRNRRPGDFELFQAYRTRELTASKPTLEQLADDKVIDQIEAENDTFYNQEIAKWGYSEWFAGALARSATTTLTFGNLTTLARAGALSRGLAAYSLWGQGLDRVLIKPALEALDKIQTTEQYAGFRSLIEPSYVDGLLTEADLQEYWTKAAIPAQVQAWVLPRLKKRREAALVREKSAASQKERDLTVSQVTQAYQGALIKRTDANNMITALGYSQKESDILLDLAETRIKAQGSAALKRLPLSDYEKAYKNGLIMIDQVLDRMKGEYAAYDIELERQLLLKGKA